MAYVPHTGPAAKRITPSEIKTISSQMNLAPPRTVKLAHLSTHFSLTGDSPNTYTDHLGKTRFAVIEKEPINTEEVSSVPPPIHPPLTYLVEKPRPSSSYSNPRGQLHMRSSEVSVAAFTSDKSISASTTTTKTSDSLRIDAVGHTIRKKASISRAATDHFHGSNVDTEQLPETEIIKQQERRHASNSQSLYKTTFVLE